ncbi:MAG: ABC transporter permease [Pseudomonadota bacterium]
MELGLWRLWQDDWLLAILRGAGVTIAAGLVSMMAGLVIGTICGIIKWRRIMPVSPLVGAYTSLIRGVPELLIIYLLFFGSVGLVTEIANAFGYSGFADAGYAFIIAVIAIGSISGGYSTEVIRGALAAVPHGQIEAAQALGLPGGRIFFRIVAPQMLRIALPGLNNVWQATIKDTALVSVVGLQELLRVSYVGANSTRHPFIFYLIAAAVYLVITMTSQLSFRGLEHIYRLRRS